MIIAFQRPVGRTDPSAIIEPDGEWSLLKIRMCEEWGIEEPFDRHKVWVKLDNGDIVLYDGEFYWIWHVAYHGEYVIDMTTGRALVEIVEEET